MVFKSKNLDRKCKYCENPPKKNLTSGRDKGYYRTCGSKKCLEKQYTDNHVCILKGRRKEIIDFICACCNFPFKTQAANHRRFCLECVPDKAWRARASRYRVGKKQWDKILESQGGKCALCIRNAEVVDHCHKFGYVRGLLCNSCNRNISVLEMDESWISNAKEYLGEKYASIS